MSRGRMTRKEHEFSLGETLQPSPLCPSWVRGAEKQHQVWYTACCSKRESWCHQQQAREMVRKAESGPTPELRHQNLHSMCTLNLRNKSVPFQKPSRTPMTMHVTSGLVSLLLLNSGCSCSWLKSQEASVNRKDRCFNQKSQQSGEKVDSCPEMNSKDFLQSWYVFKGKTDGGTESQWVREAEGWVQRGPPQLQAGWLSRCYLACVIHQQDCSAGCSG